MRNAIVRPARCTLVNVTTGESMDCLFNPTEFSEKVSVNWNRQVVPGLSHHVLQYQSTGNRQLPGIEFYLDKLFAARVMNDRSAPGVRISVLPNPKASSGQPLGRQYRKRA